MVNQRLQLSAWFALICKHASHANQVNPCVNHHGSYIVGKRRFSALKWYLVCENQLRIEAVGAI